MKIKLLGGLLLALHTSLAMGQAQPAPAAPVDGWQTVFFNSPQVALPLLTAAAVEHSAQLQAFETDKLLSQEDLKITKKNILNGVGAGASYTYGNQGGVALPDPATPAQFNTTNSSRYSAGVNVSVSLEQLLNRSHLIQRGKLSYQRTEQLRQERENQIRQQLIPLYQNVLLTKRLLTIQQDAYVSVQTNFQLSEKQFRLGQLTLPEYSQASSMLTSAAVAQEGARSQYETAFMLLEETVGAKISSLMTTTR